MSIKSSQNKDNISIFVKAPGISKKKKKKKKMGGGF
jgi:hypothetical protein